MLVVTRSSNNFPLNPVFSLVNSESKSDQSLNYSVNKSDNNPTSKEAQIFLVNTKNCKIPDLNPWDPSLKGVVKVGSHVKCDRYKKLTYQIKDTLFVDLKKIQSSSFSSVFKYCKYTPITRPVTKKSTHDTLGYGKESKPFNVSIKVEQTHEHIFVQCYDAIGKVIFVNFHTFIFDKPAVEKRCNERFKERQDSKSVKESLSILIIIIDSVSRLNAMRFMPKTVKYLMETMNATDMAGFNKVGYGTFHNMIPALTGKFYEELPWSFEKPVIFDNFTYVWNKYSDQGYRTYYAEDYPFGALFDYKKPGFQSSPADYYNRHLFLSMYQQKLKFTYNEENCILHKGQSNWVLDPAYDFLERFNSSPTFCFQLITRLTHDYLERTAGADQVYYDYFNKLNDNKLLENTMMVVMADHGMRFGDIRKWYIGLMEERLPMLYVTFPKWFGEKYPQHMMNFRTNSKRLTTHFDLHKTWLDVLNFDGKIPQWKKSDRAISFFSDMPEDRSCADAAVDPHWCTCSSLESVSVNDKSVTEAAKFFVSSVNNDLKIVSHLCETLKVHQITMAYKIRSASKDMDKILLSHKVTIQTMPGGGLFEGTVTYDLRKKFYKLGSEIDRINAYGGEKRCGVDYLQERLCYCKNNKLN